MKYPNFFFEKKLRKKGFKYIAGVDEVGRGCLAGPVVTGAVVFAPEITNSKLHLPNNIKIDDSKKLTSGQREIASKWIKKNVLAWGIGVGNCAEINKRGIVKTTHSAFHRAIYMMQKRLNNRVEYLLIDAYYIPYTRGLPTGLKLNMNKRKNPKIIYKNSRQLPIVNGDEKSISIGAASIIAKVYRDKIMQRLGVKAKYKYFNWVKNKGYGTKEHLSAIKKFGPTRYHRKLFLRNIVNS